MRRIEKEREVGMENRNGRKEMTRGGNASKPPSPCPTSNHESGQENSAERRSR
jgi:hypothetical protein